MAALLDTMQNEPRAAVVFSDLIAFGSMQGVTSQESVRGSVIERQLLLLKRHYNAIAYRGLIRASALRRLPPISGNTCDDFACDTVWMARLARAGELIRHAKPLYHKRYDERTVHAAWTKWPLDQKFAAWISHCLDMLAEALIVARSAEERRLLIEAAHRRLVLSEGAFGPYAEDIKAAGRVRRWRMQADFWTKAASRADIAPLGFALGDGLLRAVGQVMQAARSPSRPLC